MNERTFIDLISGKRRGLLATAARGFLWVLSFGYQIAVWLRGLTFDWGFRRVYHPNVPVISVGNLTTGGTGKTPVVAFLVRWFGDHGFRVGILSRGYGALNEEGNDEKRVLDQLCPGVLHLQSSNRSDIARQAVEEHGCQILVLDDGFQHRKLHRELNIVLIDATQPWGFDNVLPRGLLREPLAGLKRADFALITRADSVDDLILTNIRSVVDQHISGGLAATVAFRPTQLINVHGERGDVEIIKAQRVLGFCGIGNPDSFRQLLVSRGAEVVEFVPFPDHHHYNDVDMRTLSESTKRHNADLVVTTLKDIVKLGETQIGDADLWALSIETEFLAGFEQLESRLEQVKETLANSTTE
ncbi:MAG: tetraacyldisaccharide 4'-kinase [Planctomycetaceae bacterium]|nr:tetraacyldisaccharide 4'-kinase [Planctomycetaceae bacterium]